MGKESMRIGRFVFGAAMALAMLLPLPAGAERVGGSLSAVARGSKPIIPAGGTMVLRGSLPSTVTMTMRGAFSVGHMHNLTWSLPRMTDTHINGYDQVVSSQSYVFNVAPDSFQDLSVNGQPVRQFSWTNPPADTVITVSQQVRFRVESALVKFSTSSAFPLPPVSADAQPYLQVTPSLGLSSSQRSFAARLVRGRTTEWAVVRRVADWVATHVQYDNSLVGGPYSASWVLSHRRATCQGYSSVMAGILRVLGIPSQIVYGWVSGAPILVSRKNRSESIQWTGPTSAGATHDWLNVYFPGAGWVAFDPQMEKFFVDSRHYAFLTEVDARDPSMGDWTADTSPGQSATGRSLGNGDTEIVPGDGFFTPSLYIHDAFRVHIASVLRDVHSVTLFSR